MVVIFSIDDDTSTHQVMDWLHHLGERVMVVYPQTLAVKIGTILNLVQRGERPAFWFRKWSSAYHEQKYLNEESIKLLNYLHCITKDNCYWLNSPNDLDSNNKLIQPLLAEEAGLNIAQQHIVSTKSELLKIINSDKKFITKSFGTAIYANGDDDTTLFAYTQMIDDVLLAKMPETFYPSLVQQYIDKEFEIRTFYLDDECFSMAIFSQENDKTKVDFRHYDNAMPNRNEPICLPREVEERLRRFASAIGSNCGSFDLIQDRAGQIYFVEFNPLGQFGMVSHPCGYMLEKRIAQLLKSKNQCNTQYERIAKHDESLLPLCVMRLEQVSDGGYELCYHSDFYESDYAIVRSLHKPIDLLG